MRRVLAIAAFVAVLIIFGIAGVLAQGNSTAERNDAQKASQAQAPAAPVAAGAPARAATAEARTSEGNGVTVKVTWGGPSSGPVFEVGLDTHSGSLDYNLAESATLRNDKGVAVRATGWTGATGGHHVGGTLTFPTAAPDGTAVIGADTKSLELTISGIAGVAERKFQWQLQR